MKAHIYPLPLVAACSLLLLLAACSVREQIDDCLQYALTVKAVDTEGNDLTGSNAVTSVDIYLFDQTGFVRRVPAGTSSDFMFGYDKTSTVTLVAWGNLKADSLELPDIAVGTPIQQARLSLRCMDNGNNLPITDLFYSRQVMETVGGNAATRGLVEENITLVLERRAAGMSVRTRYLAERFGNTGEPCRFVVRGTGNALNFLGQTIGEEAGYEPASVTDGNGDAFAAPFRIFPTGTRQRIEIDILRRKETLCTIVEDMAGQPLTALPGQQLDVDIDFRYAKIKVTVTIVPWGEVKQDVEM